jgi:hypothetical protein
MSKLVVFEDCAHFPGAHIDKDRQGLDGIHRDATDALARALS